jgi:hypothetical protein
MEFKEQLIRRDEAILRLQQEKNEIKIETNEILKKV